MVGLPALPALVQRGRYERDPGFVTSLDAPLQAPFRGSVQIAPGDEDGEFVQGDIEGTISLEPVEGERGFDVRRGTLILRVDTPIRTLTTLGGGGPAVVVGSPHESLLLDQLTGESPEMPKDAAPSSTAGPARRKALACGPR